MKKLALILMVLTLSSQVYAVKLFDSEDVVSMTMELDLNDFRINKENYRETGVVGKLIMSDKSVIPVEVLSRGAGTFDNIQPPFKLKFKKADRKGTLFKGIKKIKAFTNSGMEEESEASQNQKILSNYLVYKFLELYSDKHFKTRLFKITFVDTSGVIETYTVYTFLLEPSRNVAKRLGVSAIDAKFGELTTDQIDQMRNNYDPKNVSLMTAAQFYLNNLDWGFPGLYSDIFKGEATSEKNAKFFQDASGKFFGILYDFDFSGFKYTGMCFHEYGYFMMDRTQDEIGNVAPKCNQQNLSAIMTKDFNNYTYQDNVRNEKDHYLKTFSKFKTKFKHYIDEIDPMYSTNNDIYNQTLDQIIN